MQCFWAADVNTCFGPHGNFYFGPADLDTLSRWLAFKCVLSRRCSLLSTRISQETIRTGTKQAMQCNALLTSAITDSASHYVLTEAFSARSTGILGTHSLNSHTCTLPPVGSDQPA